MRTLKFAVVTLIVGVFALPGSADAQELAQIYELTPKEGKATALESALERHAEWREDHGDPWNWQVYQVVQGKKYGPFIIRSPNHSWSDFDAYGQGFGAKAVDHYNATVAPLVKDTKARIEQTDTARSYFQEGDYSLVEGYVYKIKPGKDEAWLNGVQAVRDAYEQENRSEYFVTADVVAGSGASNRVLVVLHENYADFRDEDRSPQEVVAAVHGEEKANKIFDRFSNSYSSMYNLVLRYRPDLSVEATSGEMSGGEGQ